MAEPTILRGSDHFFNTLYEGNGGGQKVGKFVPFTDNGTIAKSCIFDDGSNPKLARTPSGAGNRDIFTWSCWMRRTGGFGTLQVIFQHGADVNNCTQFMIDTSNRLVYNQVDSGSNTDTVTTNRSFEDTSKWYHIVLAVDTTQGTAANRVRIYVDGDEITSFATSSYPSQNVDTDMNTTAAFNISSQLGGTQYPLDCYLAEVNYVDGTQYAASTFGVTDTSSGRWIPKSLESITYGTNGFRFTFANSAGQTIGDDTSGNGNDFAVTNIATSDITTDSPTQNYPTFSPFVISNAPTLSEGNLKATASTNLKYGLAASTLSWDTSDTTGYYAEFRKNDSTGLGQNFFNVGCVHNDGMYRDLDHSNADNPTDGSLVWYENGNMSISSAGDGTRIQPGNGTIGAYGNTGDVMMIAAKGDQVYFGNASKGVWYSSAGAGQTGNPATGVGGFTIEKPGRWHFMITTGYNSAAGKIADGTANFGQNPTFNGSITAVANTDGSGSLFKYTPPTGFKALMQDNLESTDSGIPDLVWIKNRDTTDTQQVYDSSRGGTKKLDASATSAESTVSDGLQKFLKGGFTVEDDASVNSVGESYVAWNWVANGGTTSANTDGSGATLASTIQVNQTAGFSIVRYGGSGTGSGVAGKVAHGLGKKPDMIIVKSETHAHEWTVYHAGISDPSDKVLYLNATNAETDWPYFGDTDPTSSVFTVSSDLQTGRVNYDYVAYCWTSIAGYSRFGSYVGNGSSDGPYINLGFKPSMVMVKCTSNSATHWEIRDNLRSASGGRNTITQVLYPNVASAEVTTDNCDFLSNGFKWRSSGGNRNENAYTYIYMAFAEHPFVGTKSFNPTTAN